jgi:hypothetical protein
LPLNRVPPLIKVVHEKIRIGRPEWTALQRNHLQAGGLAELVGDDPADHTEADEDDVRFGECCHAVPQAEY